MRRTLALAAATSAALLAVSACTVGEPIGEQQGEGVTITFLTFETPNLTPEVWDASIQRALATNPGIRVEKLVAPTQDRTSYAQQQLTSGQFPDVMVVVSPGGFAEGGHLYAWQPDELEDFVCPDCGSIGGKVYQLPANTQAIPMVYYNETLFAQAGIAAPPTTYAELLAAAEKLKAAGVTPFVIGGEHDALGPTWAGILATEVFAENPDWVTNRRAGTAKFTDPEFVAGATKLADLAARGYIDKGDLALDYAAAQQAFLDGKGAMYAMGNWFAAAADNPDTKPSFPVGQFFWPSDDGRLVAPGFTGGGLLVNAASPNLEAAKRFALSFQLDRQNLDASVKNDGLIPAIKGYSPPADAGPVFQEGARLWQEGVAKGAVVEAFGFTVGDAGLLPGVVPDWDTAAQDLVSGSKTPAEVAAFLYGEWEGLLAYTCFVLAPIVVSIGYSLTSYNPFRPPTEFVGLANYRALFTDQEFLTSLRVTTIMTLIVVIVPNVVGLGIAVLLDRRGWLYDALRSVFFTPMVLSSVVVSVIWTRLLAGDGLVNQVLGWFGVADPPGWLSDPDLALYSLSSVICWQMLGFCVVVYLAGLQGVPAELQEAAAIDGAGAVRRFREVTWPLLAPALTINTVVLLISAFKIFDHVQVITNGGPGTGTTATIAFTVLQTGFVSNRQGYASAMAVLMLIIIAVASAVVLKILQRREVQL